MYSKGIASVAIVLLVVAVLAVIGGGVWYYRSRMAAPVQQPAQEQAIPVPAAQQKMAPLTMEDAKVIAEKTCIKGGEALSGNSFYNENSKTWWFDANLNATQKGCNPACVVSEETRTAEINWRCTGLISPQTNGPESAAPAPVVPAPVSAPAAPAPQSIVIQNFSFSPATLPVSAGTKVIWTNQDGVAHTIKSAAFNSDTLNTGDLFSFTFSEKGTFNYSCGIHPSMRGSVIVR
jgi:plastocyanin